MEQFIITLKEGKKRDFFLELIKQLEFVQIVKSTKNQKKAENIKGLFESFEEVRLHQQGKKKLKSLKQALHEL